MLLRRFLIFTLYVAACFAEEKSWNATAAASYLDGRAAWWSTWKTAARDHETFCVSCHTALPYALGRQALRKALRETTASRGETALTENVSKRVALWDSLEPFYPSSAAAPNRTAESRGTEAILNALILSVSSAPEYVRAKAFDNMWATQIQSGPQKGSFAWLDFHNRPWEADDSPYFGNTLAAIAVGSGPAAERERAAGLIAYLQRNYGGQSLANRAMVLWASGKLPELLSVAQKEKLILDLSQKQQADGGWSLTAVAGEWKRRDQTELETASDGYATGLIAYAMECAGLNRSNLSLARGLQWLKENQSPDDGRWVAFSLNKKRDLNSDVGKFMSDAATGFAVLALTGK